MPGKLAEVSFMMKDSKRFPNTHGWGFATFSTTPLPTPGTEGHERGLRNTCHGCHTLVKKHDYVFTEYGKR